MSRTVYLTFAVLIFGGLINGCASNGNSGSSVAEAAFEVTPVSEHEDELRTQVKADLRQERRREGQENTRLVARKPYFYKQFHTFPEEPGLYTLEFTEKDSRTTPLIADLEVPKTRYATRLTKKRDDARADESFIRNTGIERVSYEMRNGRWRRTGSLYIADSSDEFVDGAWRPIERTRRVYEDIEEEQGGGFWSRLLFWR